MVLKIFPLLLGILIFLDPEVTALPRTGLTWACQEANTASCVFDGLKCSFVNVTTTWREYTIALWVRVAKTQPTEEETLVDFGPVVLTRSQRGYFQVRVSNVDKSNTTTFTAPEILQKSPYVWHHVAVTYSAGQITLYRNGETSLSVSGVVKYTLDAPANFYGRLGCSHSAGQDTAYFAGRMSGIVFANQGLPHDQLESLRLDTSPQDDAYGTDGFIAVTGTCDLSSLYHAEQHAVITQTALECLEACKATTSCKAWVSDPTKAAKACYLLKACYNLDTDSTDITGYLPGFLKTDAATPTVTQAVKATATSTPKPWDPKEAMREMEKVGASLLTLLNQSQAPAKESLDGMLDMIHTFVSIVDDNSDTELPARLFEHLAKVEDIVFAYGTGDDSGSKEYHYQTDIVEYHLSVRTIEDTKANNPLKVGEITLSIKVDEPPQTPVKILLSRVQSDLLKGTPQAPLLTGSVRIEVAPESSNHKGRQLLADDGQELVPLSYGLIIEVPRDSMEQEMAIAFWTEMGDWDYDNVVEGTLMSTMTEIENGASILYAFDTARTGTFGLFELENLVAYQRGRWLLLIALTFMAFLLLVVWLLGWYAEGKLAEQEGIISADYKLAARMHNACLRYTFGSPKELKQQEQRYGCLEVTILSLSCLADEMGAPRDLKIVVTVDDLEESQRIVPLSRVETISFLMLPGVHEVKMVLVAGPKNVVYGSGKLTMEFPSNFYQATKIDQVYLTISDEHLKYRGNHPYLTVKTESRQSNSNFSGRTFDGYIEVHLKSCRRLQIPVSDKSKGLNCCFKAAFGQKVDHISHTIPVDETTCQHGKGVVDTMAQLPGSFRFEADIQKLRLELLVDLPSIMNDILYGFVEVQIDPTDFQENMTVPLSWMNVDGGYQDLGCVDLHLAFVPYDGRFTRSHSVQTSLVMQVQDNSTEIAIPTRPGEHTLAQIPSIKDLCGHRDLRTARALKPGSLLRSKITKHTWLSPFLRQFNESILIPHRLVILYNYVWAAAVVAALLTKLHMTDYNHFIMSGLLASLALRPFNVYLTQLFDAWSSNGEKATPKPFLEPFSDKQLLDLLVFQPVQTAPAQPSRPHFILPTRVCASLPGSNQVSPSEELSMLPFPVSGRNTSIPSVYTQAPSSGNGSPSSSPSHKFLSSATTPPGLEQETSFKPADVAEKHRQRAMRVTNRAKRAANYVQQERERLEGLQVRHELQVPHEAKATASSEGAGFSTLFTEANGSRATTVDMYTTVLKQTGFESKNKDKQGIRPTRTRSLLGKYKVPIPQADENIAASNSPASSSFPPSPSPSPPLQPTAPMRLSSPDGPKGKQPLSTENTSSSSNTLPSSSGLTSPTPDGEGSLPQLNQERTWNPTPMPAPSDSTFRDQDKEKGPKWTVSNPRLEGVVKDEAASAPAADSFGSMGESNNGSMSIQPILEDGESNSLLQPILQWRRFIADRMMEAAIACQLSEDAREKLESDVNRIWKAEMGGPMYEKCMNRSLFSKYVHFDRYILKAKLCDPFYISACFILIGLIIAYPMMLYPATSPAPWIPFGVLAAVTLLVIVLSTKLVAGCALVTLALIESIILVGMGRPYNAVILATFVVFAIGVRICIKHSPRMAPVLCIPCTLAWANALLAQKVPLQIAPQVVLILFLWMTVNSVFKNTNESNLYLGFHLFFAAHCLQLPIFIYALSQLWPPKESLDVVYQFGIPLNVFVLLFFIILNLQADRTGSAILMEFPMYSSTLLMVGSLVWQIVCFTQVIIWSLNFTRSDRLAFYMAAGWLCVQDFLVSEPVWVLLTTCVWSRVKPLLVPRLTVPPLLYRSTRNNLSNF